MRILKISLALFLGFIMLCLTGCGDAPPAKPSPSPSVKPSESPSPSKSPDYSASEKQNNLDFNDGLDKESNSQLNINRGGLIARYEGYYYYADEKIGLLYKVKLDGSERTKVANDPFVENINIVDGQIYYTVNKFAFLYSPGNREQKVYKESARIVKYSIETGKKITSTFQGNVVIVKDSYIYYTNIKDNNSLYRCDLSFQKNTKLSDAKDISHIYFLDDYIYYLNTEGISKIKNDGSNKSLEIAGSSITDFTIDNGKIYFFSKDDGYLYSVSINKSSERKLLLSKVTDFFIRGDYIYFKQGNSELQRAKLDNVNVSDTIELFLSDIDGLTCIGNVLFNSVDAVDKLKVHGYVKKHRIDNTKLSAPICDKILEVKVGLNQFDIQNYVALNIGIEDRNRINLNIFNNLNNYFMGNSAPIYKQLIDINNDKLNEQFIIYKQVISVEGTGLDAIDIRDGWQCAMVFLRWDNNNLQVVGPYQLKSADNVLTGNINNPLIQFIGAQKDNQQIIAVYLANQGNEQIDLFKVYPTFIEPITDTKPYMHLLRVSKY